MDGPCHIRMPCVSKSGGCLPEFIRRRESFESDGFSEVPFLEPFLNEALIGLRVVVLIGPDVDQRLQEASEASFIRAASESVSGFEKCFQRLQRLSEANMGAGTVRREPTGSVSGNIRICCRSKRFLMIFKS